MTTNQQAATNSAKTTGAQMLEWDMLADHITRRLPYTLPTTRNDVFQAIIRFYMGAK